MTFAASCFNASQCVVFLPVVSLSSLFFLCVVCAVSLALDLEAGEYVVIPCFFEPGTSVDSFLLEINSSGPVKYDVEGTPMEDIDEGLANAAAAASKHAAKVADLHAAAAPSAVPESAWLLGPCRVGWGGEGRGAVSFGLCTGAGTGETPIRVAPVAPAKSVPSCACLAAILRPCVPWSCCMFVCRDWLCRFPYPTAPLSCVGL